jgi:hypothetical protein
MCRAVDTTTDSDPRPHGWFDGSTRRITSDASLGVVLLAAGTVALVDIAGMSLGHLTRLGPGFFPMVVGWMLLIMGIAALVRAALLHELDNERWSLKSVVVITIVLLCTNISMLWWLRGAFKPDDFSARDWTALYGFMLSVAIVLARASRTRAAGMVLLGMLLGTIGTDVNSGVPRLMFGVDALADGISADAVLVGFAVADGALCMVSPSLLLTIYARKVGIQLTASSLPSGWLLRAAGAVLIVSALYFADILDDPDWPFGQIALFAAFGLACQFLGWNRLVLLVAILISPLLEENVRRALLIGRGHPTDLLSSPFAGTMFLLAIVVLTIAAVLSVRRSLPRSRQV